VAEVICPSPFSAAGSLSAGVQVELVVTDSPANILWNSADKDPDITLSNNDLTATNGGVGAVRATESKTSGKWYWEVVAGGGAVGIGTSSANLGDFPGKDAHGYGYHSMGRIYHTNGWLGRASFNNTNIIGVALDLDNNKLWFLKDNVPINGGDPAAGTGEDYSGLSGTFFPMWGGTGSEATAYFTSGGQAYSPPAGFSIFQSPPSLPPFTAEESLSVGQIFPGFIDLDEAFSAESSGSATLQPELSVGALSGAVSGQAILQIELDCVDPFEVVSVFSCDHCFNYAQIDVACPTPSGEFAAVFRYARIEVEAHVPTGSFIVGKRIEDGSPVPDFTCTANIGRYPSLIASAPCPIGSMRVGLNLGDIATIGRKAGVPVPTGQFVATSAHLATMYGSVPCPIITCTGDTENVTILTASAPCLRGLFETTVGNVADILGKTPCPSCSIVAITGNVVTLSSGVPVPGPLVRFYASLKNETITITGTAPTPCMISCVRGLTSSILRHIRGEIR